MKHYRVVVGTEADMTITQDLECQGEHLVSRGSI